jgi:superfamily II RNA helicase
VAKAAKRRKDDDGAPENLGEQEHSWENSFDPNEPSPQFSFTGITTYSRSDLAKNIQELRRWAPDWALDALERGVGVHHAGMNKKYRSLVERCAKVSLPN